MDQKCDICGKELEPASYAQLTFYGGWICEKCLAPSDDMHVPATVVPIRPEWA